jgi:hypothetical protein
MQRYSNDAIQSGDPNKWIEKEFAQLDNNRDKPQTNEQSFGKNEFTIATSDKNANNQNSKSIAGKRSLSDQIKNSLIKKQNFTYVHQHNAKIDTKMVLYCCLFLYLVEYLIIFAFQMISYLVIVQQWRDSSWVIGVVLAIVYVPVCIAIYYIQFRKEKILLYILKFLEFGIHFVFLGWAVAYADFSFLALSYLMVLNVLVIFIFVY